MAGISLLRRFLRNQSGETIIEFAIVSVVFFTLMCALIEYGLIMMTQIALETVTQHVARSSAIDTSTAGCDRVCQIKTQIQAKTFNLINPQYVVVTSEVITAPTDGPPPEPDVCHDDLNNPYPPSCAGPYDEHNGIPLYQPPSVSAGSSNALVQISVFYTWHVIFPLLVPFFPNGVVKMSSTTVIKNEPF